MTTRRGGFAATWLSAVLVLFSASPARSATWNETFAADTDTVVFFGTGGDLWRAPFHLASRETLWAPRGDEHLVRVSVSPDGRGVAWITRRALESDTSRVWAAHDGKVRDAVRYTSLQPSRYDRLHYEPSLPTLEDASVHGARLIQPTAFTRRVSSNTLDWTPDSRAVVFGFDDGIAAVPVDSGMAFEVSKALAVEMRLLEPAPIFLVDAVVLRGHELTPAAPAVGASGESDTGPDAGSGSTRRTVRPAQGGYLLYPLPHRWRVFGAEGFDLSRPWAADEGTVWWAEARNIRAIRTSDPRVTEEKKAEQSVTWLGFVPATRELAWAAGRTFHVRAADGGADSVVATLGSPIRNVLRPATGDRIGIAGERLVVWDPRTRVAQAVSLDGRSASQLFEGQGGALLLASEGPRDHTPQLARVDLEAGRLAPIATPAIRGGRMVATPGGAHILLFDAGPQAPSRLHVYDVATGVWSEVANPGITGWEPLAPR
jgi:hypothetical protein